jgi:glycosyltransferase involved in cell wall biosynthesis
VAFHRFRPSDALVPMYHASSLFVLSSRHEAAGVVLLEAAACGLPVAGTAVGYLADWTPDRATTVAPGDPLALANAIASLLTDDTRRESTARAASEWARAHDADWTARAFESLYAGLVSASPSRRHAALA